MKKRLNKSLSIFLAVIMVISAVPFASFISSLEASASSATYEEEYYYPAGTQFLTDLAVSRREYSMWSGGRQDDCKRYLTNAGYTLLGVNCNAGKSKDYIHIGYKMGTDESQAIRAFAYYNGGNPPSTYDYTINGHTCTFHLVTKGYNNSGTLSNTAIDLNTSAGGDYIFLYYTKDPNAGAPITSLDHDENKTNNSDNAAQIPGVWMNAGLEGEVADLNRNAKGDYIYTFYGQTGTSVDTAALHNAINNANSYLSNSGKYTSATVSALQSAVNNAKPIVDDYNADGLSDEYDQTAITNASNAITNAINSLQTTVTFNANGGSISTTSFNVTVGTATTINVDLSPYIPTRAGFDFKGWSTSSTAESGSTGTVSVGLMPTFYAIWEQNTFKVYFDDEYSGMTVVYGEAFGTLPSPTKEHYDFIGWHTKDGTPVDSNTVLKERADVYLYSEWMEKTYAITWKWIGDPDTKTVDYLYGENIEIPAPSPMTSDESYHYTYEWNNIPETATGTATYTETKVTEAHNPGELRIHQAPTCTTLGRQVQYCTVCNYLIVNEEIPATGHQGAWTRVSDPTCTEAGKETRECTVCHVNEERAVDALGHKYDKVVTDPTCTERGFTTYTCSVCGYEHVADYVDSLGHTNLPAVKENEKAPDCVNTGSYDSVVYCSVCGAEVSRTEVPVDALGHKYEDVVTPPTCLEKGYTTHTCSVCNDGYVDTYVDALGHKEVVDKAVEATCTTTGLTEGKHCSVCNEVLKEQTVIDALGHKEAAAVEENRVEANCVDDGKFDTVVYCSVCKEELSRKTTVIPALGHKEAEAVIENKVDPDCENTGKYDTVVYCSVCDAELSRVETIVDALGHKAGEIVVENNVAPTCTEKGHYDNVVYCTVCEKELSRKTIAVDALGHKYGKVVTDPTCTDKGFTTYTCSVCNHTYEDNYVDALGHKAGESVMEHFVDSSCSVQGSYDEVVYCTVCKAEISRVEKVVDLKAHTEGEVVVENKVPATCTTDGSYDNVVYCTKCSVVLSRETIPVDALGHKEVTETVAATCTADGKVTVKCSVCDTIISEETIKATGHLMSDWAVVKYPTFEETGSKEKSCANCDYAETETLKPVKLRPTRILSTEIEENNITIVGYTNADSIAFYRTTAAGEDIIFDMFYDEEDLANEPTPIKYGDNSPRWIIYNSRWSQYAVDGKYTDTITIAGVKYNLTVIMNTRDLEENDIVLTEKFTNITVDNENKVITLIPPKGTESITMKQTSRQFDEFTYTIDADSYDNVTLNEVSGAHRGSYTISANGEFETEITVTVNKGKYCQEYYTLKVIFIDFDLVSELKPLRGTVSLETDADGREYLKVTMAEGQSSTGIYKTGKGTAVTDVKVTLADGNMSEKDNLYVGYVKSNTSNPTGEVTISLSNGSVLTYDIVFDMGVVKSEIDPLSELRLVRATASFDADETLRITRNAGLATSAGAGFYATTTAGEAVTFTTEQGTVYAGRTDAFIAYLTQNTSNVKGVISYTLSDGTEVSYKAVIDLALGDEYTEPEEPAYDLAKDLKAIRGTVSVTDNTVTITVADGKTATGIYNTTVSGATVEITTENGTFADRTDAYVAYKSSNTANVEGLMTVTFADGTTQEYTVIFDLGL